MSSAISENSVTALVRARRPANPIPRVKEISMARNTSTQHKLDRVRPPRVHITYDVEVGNAIEMKELPFVMGVLGDFSGQPSQPLPRLRDR